MQNEKSTDQQSLLLRPLWEILEEVDTEIKSRGQAPRYPIGLSDLDEMIWGLHKKEILTVGARTSMGKSALVTHFLYSLGDANLRVVDFTNEMTEGQMCERLLTHSGDINNLALRSGHIPDDYEPKLKMFKKWAYNCNILLTNKYGRTFEGVLSVCEKIKPDFIIIDYIQMIRGAGDKKAAMDDFLIRIGELSKDMNFGVINVSQINRGAAEDGRPGLHQLKGSGVLEEFSDAVLLLHWKKNDADIKQSEFFIYVEKQRHGSTGKVQVTFLPQFNKFVDYVPDPKKPEDKDVKKVEPNYQDTN